MKKPVNLPMGACFDATSRK